MAVFRYCEGANVSESFNHKTLQIGDIVMLNGKYLERTFIGVITEVDRKTYKVRWFSDDRETTYSFGIKTFLTLVRDIKE